MCACVCEKGGQSAVWQPASGHRLQKRCTPATPAATPCAPQEPGTRCARCSYKKGYKNIISKGVELNEAGVPCPLMMETSGHGAMRVRTHRALLGTREAAPAAP